MNADRLGPGATIAAVAAIVLLIVMFLGWFQLEGITASAGDLPEGVPDTFELGGEELEALAEEEGEDTSASAWQSFSFIDIVLLIAIVAALGVAIAKATGAGGPPSSTLGMVVAALGALGAVLVLFRLISPPDLIEAFGGGVTEDVDVETDVGREIWSFVGLIAAAGIAYGGFRLMQEAPQAAPPPPPQTPAPPPPTQTPPPPASGTGAPPAGPTV
jgi:hypothetical protein